MTIGIGDDGAVGDPFCVGVVEFVVVPGCVVPGCAGFVVSRESVGDAWGCCFCVPVLRVGGVLRLVDWARVTDESAKRTSKETVRERAAALVTVRATALVVIFELFIISA